jgi:hypothetical protein
VEGLNMKMEQVVRILKDEGYTKELSYDSNELKEVMTYQEDDYYLIKKEAKTWCFYHVTNERKKECKLLGEYNTEEKAMVHFLLNRLDSLYLDKYILLAKKECKFYERINILDIVYLKSAIKNVGIPEYYISYKSKTNNSIYIYEEDDGWHTEYVARDGNLFLKTIAETKARCISIAFTRSYYIYLLDKLMEKYIKNGVMDKKFGIDDILYYLGSK